MSGDAVEVFPAWVTQEELDDLEKNKNEYDEMKSSYEKVKNELESYKTAEIKAEKEKILADDAYTQFSDEDEFKELKNDMDKFSVDEFKEKAEVAFAKCVKRIGNFSALNSTKHSLGNPSVEEEKKSPYGDLFD